MKWTAKNIALCAVLAALALGLSTLEGLFPISLLVPLPGVKLGLANIVTVFALYQLGAGAALAILLTRCLLGGLFAGNLSAMLFSVLGGLTAMLVMIFLRRLPKLSVYGVSIGGAQHRPDGRGGHHPWQHHGPGLSALPAGRVPFHRCADRLHHCASAACHAAYPISLRGATMDKKDQIILQQLDVIRSMTENNVRRTGSDFWGTPFQDVGKAPTAPGKPAEPEKPVPPTADAKPGDAAPEKAEELPPPEKIEDLLAELDTYIGLNVVKDEVHDLINMVQVYKLREQHDLPTTDMSLHMVFTGNPGTGKTMMARMMARIYRSLGILSKGQLVEVDRSGLVAGYVGQTALKTQKVIEKAMGGVLFIDEAYALNGKSENDFGQEAIDTILKAMEDHRDNLVVIVAGYTELMDKFIHSNPGLESRFNRFLLFEDYTPEEMFEIFKMRCGKGYVLAPEAEPLVRDYIAEESADPSFGNARGVRNLFEHILVAQNNRLAKLETVTREDLMTITPDDVLHARGKLDD